MGSNFATEIPGRYGRLLVNIIDTANDVDKNHHALNSDNSNVSNLSKRLGISGLGQIRQFFFFILFRCGLLGSILLQENITFHIASS